MSDDTMYPASMYPGGSEEEFARLKAASFASFDTFVTRGWGAVEPCSERWLIAVMGLAGETGEVIEPCKKHFRDGKHPGEDLKLELGDVLHYLTVIAASYGWTLDEVARANMKKLKARDAAGVPRGALEHSGEARR